MNENPSAQITELLNRSSQGDTTARERLFELVYEELRRIARAEQCAGGETLQPTAIVHEAYLRFYSGPAGGPVFQSRKHFFAAAAKAMRHLIIDDVRRRGRQKRGGARTVGPGRIDSLREDDAVSLDHDSGRLLAIHEALANLETLAPRQAKVVELRFFGGLSVDETADALNISPRSVDSDWRLARIWLHRELS